MKQKSKEALLWAGAGFGGLIAAVSLFHAVESANTAAEYGDRVKAEYSFEDSHQQALHAEQVGLALGATLLFATAGVLSASFANDERQARSSQQTHPQERITA